MFWKIYAWIYVVTTVVGLLFLISTISSWNFGSWEGIIESILLAVGVFVFAYKKSLFNKNAWKFIFIAILLIWIIDIVSYTLNIPFFNFLKENVVKASVGEVLFSIIVSIPALVAIYKMAFRKENLESISK